MASPFFLDMYCFFFSWYVLFYILRFCFPLNYLWYALHVEFWRVVITIACIYPCHVIQVASPHLISNIFPLNFNLWIILIIIWKWDHPHSDHLYQMKRVCRLLGMDQWVLCLHHDRFLNEILESAQSNRNVSLKIKWIMRREKENSEALLENSKNMLDNIACLSMQRLNNSFAFAGLYDFFKIK